MNYCNCKSVSCNGVLEHTHIYIYMAQFVGECDGFERF